MISSDTKNLLRMGDVRDRLGAAEKHVQQATAQLESIKRDAGKISLAESQELRNQLVTIAEWVNSARRRVLDMTPGLGDVSLEARERREGLARDDDDDPGFYPGKWGGGEAEMPPIHYDGPGQDAG
jgi:hypothetical protein